MTAQDRAFPLNRRVIELLALDHPTALHISGIARRLGVPQKSRIRDLTGDLEQRGVLTSTVAPGPGQRRFYHLTASGLLLSKLPLVSPLWLRTDRGSAGSTVRLTPDLVRVLRFAHRAPEQGFLIKAAQAYLEWDEAYLRVIVDRLIRSLTLESHPTEDGRYRRYRLTGPGRDLAEQCSHPDLPLEVFGAPD